MRWRVYILSCLIIVGLGVLLTRLYEFQILHREDFMRLVPGNRLVIVREPGFRGEVFDRQGYQMVKNIRTYEVSLNLQEIANAYQSDFLEEQRLLKAHKQKGAEKVDPETDIVAIVNHWLVPKLHSLGLEKTFSEKSMRVHFNEHHGLVPFTYCTDISFEEFSRFAEHSNELPGVYIRTKGRREYPFHALASHLMGYVKAWSNGDVPEEAADKYNNYIGDDQGQAGIEKSMDAVLRGPEGIKKIIKDEKGHNIGILDEIKPGLGADVHLTIDMELQYLLEGALRRTGRAAGVIMDVNTGEVLAMVSVPGYDPNDFIPSIDVKKWEEYNSDKLLAPLTNRAISAFSPGSTMKLATAISAARKGMATNHFSCDGFVTYGNSKVRCWIYEHGHGSHGGMSLSDALQKSCNPYFNKLANSIGSKAMVEGFSMMGYGEKTQIELPQEQAGILPGSKRWRDAHPNANMTPILNAFLSIGQGDMMASPIQICSAACAIANGGTYYQPRIIKKAVAQDGKVFVADAPKVKVNLLTSGVKSSDLELIRKGMWMAVNKPGGTAGKIKMSSVEIAAKTGTARTAENGVKTNNSWVISFAPFDKPRYAVCVVVQNAGSGGAVCGPLVNLIYTGLFAKERGIKLPVGPLDVYKGNLKRFEEMKLPADVLAVVTSPLHNQPALVEAPSAGNNLDPDEGETGAETDVEPGDSMLEHTLVPDSSSTIPPNPSANTPPER